jgi:UDP-N-acetylglucosamine 1-carboxyvinyltransferase
MPRDPALPAHSAQSTGILIREARRRHGWTKAQLADTLGISWSEINDIENGQRQIDEPTLDRLAKAIDAGPFPLDESLPLHLRVEGGLELSGVIDVKTSKNSGVAVLCASMLNKGRTTLRRVARIEEINRIIEVLRSIGFTISWINDQKDLQVDPPEELNLADLDAEAACRTRSIIMFLAPLMRERTHFQLPYAGGCNLGTRTIEPHMVGLRPFGLEVKASGGFYHAEVIPGTGPSKPIVLIERGDTVTENVLMAAARIEGPTIIRNASCNYMVQDLCFLLSEFGVRIEGIGTTTLTVHGVTAINRDVDFSPSEDPIEAMSLLTAAIVTSSSITIRRVPIEFLEIELAILDEMGLRFERSPEYPAANGRTRLIDLTVFPSALRAPADKIHPMPFPGLNIDNLPFFALIAATASGSTLIHDWVYENRALYLTELTRLGAKVTLLDPHRIYVEGPTRWSGTEVICPPALRPAVVILLAMLAAKGTSVLRNIYVIDRGYELLAERLNLLGAHVDVFRDR